MQRAFYSHTVTFPYNSDFGKSLTVIGEEGGSLFSDEPRGVDIFQEVLTAGIPGLL